MNNSLVVDILYPNKYSRWRNLEINFFMDEFNSDILVFKIDGFDKSPEKSGQTYTIRGTIDIPKLYITKNKSYNLT